MANYQLANFNIARMRSLSIDDPVMTGFVEALDEINHIADETPGFVWRLQTEDGHATSIRPFEDDRLLINLTVWDSLDSLRGYVYQSRHGEFLRRGREWFEPPPGDSLVLWWIRMDERPTAAQGVAKLERLRRDGPTVEAFSFKNHWPKPQT